MKKVLFILLAALVVVGCKKENKIEKNLWKKGGEWNITTWDEKRVSTYDYYGNDYSDTYYNAGTMQFNKDGSGVMIFKDGSSSYKDNFTYKNTENTLTIYDEDGEGVIFDLDWKKNEFTISNKEVQTYIDYDENNNPFTETVTYSTRMVCKKK